ncbi:DNA primase [Pisciglobus halotolerans]|uniref:DNA primase n=1 Tax=Pisciglobus halotolerans TaxID=745365 RepID=A0A1I3BAI1_9LACT|nr:DNA primase [Pisciglobus halotolerans]SFH59303.1 DNA primase [Pisciglobus halotolerans]
MAVRIPEETVNEIRERTNIADVVSQYVQLKKSGKNLFGFCPFHDERTPSFSVTEEKQIFHCFSCGRGGNVYSFLMEIEGLSFPEAVIKTAELSDIPIDSRFTQLQQGAGTEKDTKKATLLKLHEESAELFQHILMNTQTGEAALSYLQNRGLSKETIEAFSIGFAPKERTVLVQYLQGKGYTDEQLEESGLFIKRESGELQDRFHGRILFPIEDHQGKIIAFSGRLFEEQPELSTGRHEPKYLNSPETYLFNKRRVLFNFHRARPTIRKESEVILFEGFMDVIAAYQAGVQHGVASMGTSLTNEHIHLLDKVVDKVVIAYDGDQAGIEATKRAADTFAEETHFDIEIVQFADGMDPDEFIKKKGEASFNELIRHGRATHFNFIMQYYRRNIHLNNENERLNYIDKILTEMLNVPSAIEREHYFKQLSEEFDLSLAALEEQFQQIFHSRKSQSDRRHQEKKVEPRKEIFFPQVQQQRRKLSSVERTERQLLNRVFHFDEARLEVKNFSDIFHFVHDEYQMLYLLYESFLEQTDHQGTMDAFIDFVKEPDLKNILVEIELMTMSEDFSIREIQDCMDVISRKSVLEEKIKEKQQAIKEASHHGDQEQLRSLMAEIVELSRELKTKPV